MRFIRFIFSLRFLAIMIVLFTLLLLSTRLFSFSLSEETIAENFEKSDYQPAHHYYEYKGEYMHYVTCGDSLLTPLLLVHGSPGSWDNFVKIIQETDVLSNYYIIAIDRPGYGQSGMKQMRNLESQSRTMKELIDRYFSNQRGVILGHSYGGAVCLQLAVDYPNQISALISAAGTLADVYQEPRWYNYIVKYTPVGWLLDGSFDLSNKEMWNLPEDLRLVYPSLRETKVRTIIIQGGRDFLVNPETAGYIQNKMPEAELHTIYRKDMDHFLIWNDLQAIEKALNLVSLDQGS